jgi:CRP/FNR family cyclic AMP-dependent transcriptional regulator
VNWLIFTGVPPAAVDDVLAEARSRSFGRGEVVFHAGDDGETTHLVRTGHFAMRVLGENGRDGTVRIYSPGDSFGRMALGPLTAVRSASMVAVEGGETYELRRSQLDRLRKAHPCVNDTLVAEMGRVLYWVSERYLEVLYVDADRRVRRRLLELGAQYATDGGGVVEIGLTQEDIAGLAGTSRATVNRVLGDEEQLGTIERRRGRIAILDAAALAERAKQPPVVARF